MELQGIINYNEYIDYLIKVVCKILNSLVYFIFFCQEQKNITNKKNNIVNNIRHSI